MSKMFDNKSVYTKLRDLPFQKNPGEINRGQRHPPKNHEYKVWRDPGFTITHKFHEF